MEMLGLGPHIVKPSFYQTKIDQSNSLELSNLLFKHLFQKDHQTYSNKIAYFVLFPLPPLEPQWSLFGFGFIHCMFNFVLGVSRKTRDIPKGPIAELIIDRCERWPKYGRTQAAGKYRGWSEKIRAKYGGTRAAGKTR